MASILYLKSNLIVTYVEVRMFFISVLFFSCKPTHLPFKSSVQRTEGRGLCQGILSLIPKLSYRVRVPFIRAIKCFFVVCLVDGEKVGRGWTIGGFLVE